MTGQLITLPARLYLRGARLLLHVAEDVTGRAVTSTLRVAGTLGNLVPGGGGAQPSPSPARGSEQSSTDEQPARNGHPRQEEQQSSESAPETAGRNGNEPRSIPRDPRSDTSAEEPDIMAAEDAAIAEAETEPLASERLAQEGATASIDLDADTSEPVHVSEDAVVVRESAEPGAEDGAGASVTVQEPWDGYAQMSARDVIARISGASAAELAAVQLYELSSRGRQTVLQAAERELRSTSSGQ